jgi:hypothetical protein
MRALKDFACITCRREAIRLVLAVERHLHLQCDGCGQQSAIPERRQSVSVHQLASAVQPHTTLEAVVFPYRCGTPLGNAPPQVAAATHQPDLPGDNLEAPDSR